MSDGKRKCRILKEIRRRIAEANDIRLVTEECSYKGSCRGTCPRCEAEVRYLEGQLHDRRLSGRAVAIAGVSAGMLLMGGGSHAYSRNVPMEDITVENEPMASQVATDTVEENNHIFGMVDMQSPSMPGGDVAIFKFIKENIVYPEEAVKAGIEGRVVVKVLVEEDGTVSNAVVVRSKHPALDREALRVVSLIPFTPGMCDGKPVASWFTMPITFRLPKTPGNE